MFKPMYRLAASRFCLLAAFVCLGVYSLNASIVMQIPGITGDSNVPGHAGWVDVSSYQHGIGAAASVPPGSSTVQVSKPSYSEIVLTKRFDRSSIPITSKMNTSTASSPIVIEFLTGGNTPVVYYRLTLTGAYFTGQSISSGGDNPSESLSIFYSKMAWEYYPIDNSGKVGAAVRGEWDVINNVGK